jgi:hypothetical protein
MTATVVVHSTNGRVAVTLDAVELPVARLSCELTGDPAVVTHCGEAYSRGAVQVLCFSGVALARRALGLANGVDVHVSSMCGVLDKTEEVGVCYAVAVAIARSLQKADRCLLEIDSGWHVSDRG